MDKKLTIITSLVGGLLVLGVVGYIAFMFFGGSAATNTSDNNSGGTKTVGVKDCGKLTADDNKVSGKAPFSPVLRAKLNKNADSKTPACSWSINDQFSHLSVPVSGSCVFGGVPINTPGTYKASLEVQSTDCKIDTTVTVN